MANYEALFHRLFTLKRLPDASGATVLTLEEASEIRALGFAAEGGPWTVPRLPQQLVRDTAFESWSS